MILRTACIFKTAEQNLGRDRRADNHFSRNLTRARNGVTGMLFLEFLHRHLLEEDHILVTVVLQPDVALERPRSTLRLKIKLLLRHRIAFPIVCHLHTVEDHDRSRTIQGDFHEVPPGPGLPGFANGFVSEYRLPVT